MPSDYCLEKMTGVPRGKINIIFDDRSQGSQFQKLETLGDKVLSLIVMDELFSKDLNENDTGQLESLCTKNCNLSRIHQRLGQEIFPSFKGQEETSPDSKIYADMIEALIGLIYREKGIENTKAFVKKFLFPEMEKIISQGLGDIPDKLLTSEKKKKKPNNDIVTIRRKKSSNYGYINRMPMAAFPR